ncbi:MAG: 30S ribosomal protein S20 [Ignavibacteria bacterium]|nr:30S ribosomal protein S20 [Ignavibacteria bacterium]
MAHHKSALKRIRKSRRQKLYNRQFKRAIKYASREVREAKTFEEASEKLRKASKVYDKAAIKKVIHKNNAANHKSALAKYVNSLKVQVQA